MYDASGDGDDVDPEVGGGEEIDVAEKVQRLVLLVEAEAKLEIFVVVVKMVDETMTEIYKLVATNSRQTFKIYCIFNQSSQRFLK